MDTGRPATSPRRHSLLEPLFAGIDIGGTNQTVAIGDRSGALRHITRLRTPPAGTAREIVASVAQALKGLLRTAGIERPAAIGIGFGGPVDFERGLILRSFHVSEWDGFPLRAELTERFGAPVALDNDANAGALGEARFGAGRAHRHLLYVNVGTGIGAGIILDGRLHRGANGLAGELGHVTVERDGAACACGKWGCLEAYASGRAIGGPAVTRAAEAGDLDARRRLEEAGRWLAIAIGGAVNVLNPSAVIVGGGVVEAGELLLAPLRAHLGTQVMPGLPIPAVLRAALGYDAGVVGALALAIDLTPPAP